MNDESDGSERIKPFYETLVPDGEIILAKEEAKLIERNSWEDSPTLIAEGFVQVVLEWSPMRLEFEFTGTLTDESELPDTDIEDGLINLDPDVEIVATTFSAIGHIHGCGRNAVDGEIHQTLIIAGTGHPLTRVIFHLPDYTTIPGRNASSNKGSEGDSEKMPSDVAIFADPWQIELQAIDHPFYLKNDSYRKHQTLLTGVGRISKIDRSEFSTSSAEELLGTLEFFFALVFRHWSPPLLAVGSNDVSEKSWQYWKIHRIQGDRDSGCKSWLPVDGHQSISDAFACFLKSWADREFREVLKLSISWLVESSSQSNPDEQAIVFAQVPLEMLAWMVFVEREEIINQNEFDRLSASSKLQLLLSHCQISFEIPSRLSTIFRLGGITKSLSAPQILTKVRNVIVHPSKKNRRTLQGWIDSDGIDAESLFAEARLLWEHYITLVLLFLIGYQGNYSSRLFGRELTGDPVPWSINPSGSKTE